MLNCLPGMASRTNRAETSLALTAPWATTMYWMAMITRKTITPTT
ncbi:MAG: hypothetical protein BWY86_00206 [Candidatus Aminicenantes bacterium ADurb.Bin508]|nr:MAG: hypothetical protein BWY86_00206 [Candidatus Aminicenantes bacterium ADurb.Bin508]